jgi:FkbM family methyltransferase
MALPSLNYALRRARLAAWKVVRPTLSIGDRNIKVRPSHVHMLRVYRNWQPNWKTTVVRNILQKRPGLFVDVGVNLGQTLVDYCQSGTRSGYLGFEPNPLCVNIVNEIIEANNLADCSVVPVGLSEGSDVLPLFTRKHVPVDGGATIVSRPYVAAEDYVTHLIPVFKFDDVAARLGLNTISLVKIDVEGAEIHVFRGMGETLRAMTPWLICEVLYRDGRADKAETQEYVRKVAALMDFIRSASYVVFRILKSSDQQLVGFEQVNEFPNKAWAKANGHECDYLIAPEADSAQLADLFGIPVRTLAYG